MIKKTYQVAGMSCSSCALSIETYLGTTRGIEEARVNFANESLSVTYDDKTITEEEIFIIVKELGYEVIPEEKKSESISFKVEGMSCSSCANTVELTVKNLPGVNDAVLNFASEKLTLKYNNKVIKLSQIQKAVEDVGYNLVLENNNQEINSTEDKHTNTAKTKVYVSAVISTVIMTLMLINMFLQEIPGYIFIVAILAFPVVFVVGFDVHKKSFKSLKRGRPNMDVLVSLGSLPPYLVGLLGLFFPITTFIEMATMIMTLHLVGKYLETKAKGKASQAIKKLLEIGAKTAKIIVNTEEIEVLTSELAVGDVMIIRPGEKIPMDGIVVDGESTVDESLATGESLPVKRSIGENVIGATINKNGVLKVKVTKIGDETFLAQIIKMVEACQGSKVPIQEFADRITGIFVPGILVITLLTFISFNVFPEFHLSILRYFENIFPWINTDQNILSLAFVTATAVLVIACPCALGLGTPTALMVGSGKGAENGILIRNGEAVQTFKDIKAIAFDKTGTLTVGRPVITDIVAENQREILEIAVSLESSSEHVLAQAIIERAKQENITAKSIKDFEAITGQGISGKIDNEEYLIGNVKLFDEHSIDTSNFSREIDRLESEAKTVIIIGNNTSILGIIAIADELKANAKQTIKAIERLGIKTVMITGDNKNTAEAIAKKCGISEIVANVLPDGKVNEIKNLQTKYGLVAMVGDGINDAPALKQANVGMALGTGTDVAIESSDITLVSGDLAAIVKAINLSRAIFAKIKQNYFWAWFYNAIAIPFAMFGLLHPMIGALAMSFSSLNVIYNSLRLKKFNLNKNLEVNYDV
ncbi:MAG: heavy metal translocating P-type ATPase [Candidatus Izemoplasmatales bacterium]|nr:heavy metal translocating P-type ATPase [Candidatus Izemoplasmatales bacterium]